MNDKKKFWPITLAEFRAEIDAYKLLTEYPPGDVRRYQAQPDNQGKSMSKPVLKCIDGDA